MVERSQYETVEWGTLEHTDTDTGIYMDTGIDTDTDRQRSGTFSVRNSGIRKIRTHRHKHRLQTQTWIQTQTAIQTANKQLLT